MRTTGALPTTLLSAEQQQPIRRKSRSSLGGVCVLIAADQDTSPGSVPFQLASMAELSAPLAKMQQGVTAFGIKPKAPISSLAVVNAAGSSERHPAAPRDDSPAVPGRNPKHQTGAAVHLAHLTKIPPQTGCFLDGCIARAGPADGVVVLTPVTARTLTLLPSILTAKDRRCSVWAINTSSRTLTLHGGTRLGTVAPVEATCCTDPSQVVFARSDKCPVKSDYRMTEHREDTISFAQTHPLITDFLNDSQDDYDVARTRSSKSSVEADVLAINNDAFGDFEREDDGFFWDDYRDAPCWSEDFGDSDAEVEHAELPPSIAIAVCEAADMLIRSVL